MFARDFAVAPSMASPRITRCPAAEATCAMLRLVLIIVLFLLLLGALPAWPYSSGWGYYPSGGLGLLLVIVLVLVLVDRRGLP